MEFVILVRGDEKYIEFVGISLWWGISFLFVDFKIVLCLTRNLICIQTFRGIHTHSK